jgi:hypothetical protein
LVFGGVEMRKIILVLLLINTLIKATTFEEKMDLVDKYLCSYEKYYCSKDITARAYHNIFIKYQKQYFNKKLQTTDGLNLPQNINNAFNTLNSFEYNHFPKYKLSETLLPILKMYEIKKMYYRYDKELALLSKSETGYKLPYNIKSIISKVNQKNYNILATYQHNKKDIYWENKATFEGFSNYLYQGGLDLVNITNASWEVSLATFLKAAKYAKKVVKAKKTIEALSEIQGYGTAAYKFMNLVKDVDNLKAENQSHTMKTIGDIIDMLNDASGGTSASKIAKLLIDIGLQERQYEAFHTLIKYYKDSPIEDQLVLSRNQLYNRIILSLSSLMNEVFEITGLSAVEGIGDAVAVTNALVQVFGNNPTLYNSQMSKTSISNKYLEAHIKGELYIINNWIIKKYNALYPYAKFKLNRTNNFYSLKQDTLGGVFIAGFNYDDTNRVDKCVKVGDFYSALDLDIELKSNYLHIDEFHTYANKHGNKDISIAKAIYFLDKYTYAYFKSQGRASELRYKKYAIHPPFTDKKNLRKYKILYRNWNLNLSVEEKRQFLQVQGYSMGRNKDSFNNLNECLNGFKAIKFLYNYKMIINKNVELRKEGN